MHGGILNSRRLPTKNLVEDENRNLLADSHVILSIWKYFCQQLNVHGTNDVMQRNAFSWNIRSQTQLL
jgi:hypothetical protein